MHIEKIKIKNFKCFRNEFELILNKNVNIIVGENEAGKSTIIEALNLILSGWFKGRYIHNELNEYIFNKVIVKEYIESLQTETPLAPPSIKIEVFCLPCMQTIPGLERKPAHLIGGKSNVKSSASLATVGCEGRPSKLVEYREIEPILAYIGGKVAKSADAQNPNSNIC